MPVLRIALRLVVAMVCWTEARADGLVIDGHVRSKHTDITLVESQARQLDAGARVVRLTSHQRRELLAHIGKGAGVVELTVHPPDIETCTCEEANVAARVSRTLLEVPNFLSGRDLIAEARLHEAARRREKLEQYRREQTTERSAEAQLTERGRRLLFADDYTGAITALEQALRMNPRLSDAKLHLRNAYSFRATQLRERGLKSELYQIQRKHLALIPDSDDLIRPHVAREVQKLAVELSLSSPATTR